MNQAVASISQVRRAIAWLRDSALSVAAILIVLLVAASGWSASFLSLHLFAIEHMSLTSGQAWFVPGTFDGAAGGLSLLAFRAATHGRASFGSRVYVYGFTALSSWINYVHISDPRGRWVASLLPISAVVVFDKVLKEAREAYERRNGKQAFRVRPGLLLLRLVIDRAVTGSAIKSQITAIPIEALIGLGAGTLAAAVPPVDLPVEAVDPVAEVAATFGLPETWSALAPQVSPPVDNTVDTEAESVDRPTPAAPTAPKFLAPQARLATHEAAGRIREGWELGWGVTETAEYATRDKAQVSRKFSEFAELNGHTLALANGSHS